MPTFLFLCIIVICSLCLSRKESENRIKAGAKGEGKVARELKKLPFKTVNDAHVSGCQIDHIVYGDRNIYVIETKNWAGRITGSARSKYWSQYQPSIGERRLYSPLFQNRKHVEAVAATDPGKPVLGIVVFAGTAAPPEGLGGRVLRLTELTGFIIEHEKEHSCK